MQVKKTPSQNPASYRMQTPLTDNWETLSIEGLACKYDMPILANMALERLEYHLKNFAHFHWNPMTPEYIDTGEEVTREFWQIAERAVHWKHKGVLDACMEIIAHPLMFESEKDGLQGTYPGLIVLPASASSFALMGEGVVPSLVRAVNKALLKKAGHRWEDVPEDHEVSWKYL